jgi:hypothetical protein
MAMTWGIAQFPIQARKKAPACFDNFPEKASTDPNVIRGWAADFLNCNFGSIALDKHAILEVDVPDPKLLMRQPQGQMLYWDLYKEMKADKYETLVWEVRIYKGLLLSGRIHEFGSGSNRTVQLVQALVSEEEAA